MKEFGESLCGHCLSDTGWPSMKRQHQESNITTKSNESLCSDCQAITLPERWESTTDQKFHQHTNLFVCAQTCRLCRMMLDGLREDWALRNRSLGLADDYLKDDWQSGTIRNTVDIQWIGAQFNCTRTDFMELVLQTRDDSRRGVNPPECFLLLHVLQG